MTQNLRRIQIGLLGLLFTLNLLGEVSLVHAEVPFWPTLSPLVQARVNQKSRKMKLTSDDANQFRKFLENLEEPAPQLSALQSILPKTTIELLMAVSQRGLALSEAEKMASYLSSVVDQFKFSNISAFDENTSHIIGREWHEIDYSGENMTWEKQKAKYQPYGVDHFKSLECLKKFIPVESKLPYFKKIYKPKSS